MLKVLWGKVGQAHLHRLLVQRAKGGIVFAVLLAWPGAIRPDVALRLLPPAVALGLTLRVWRLPYELGAHRWRHHLAARLAAVTLFPVLLAAAALLVRPVHALGRLHPAIIASAPD